MNFTSKQGCAMNVNAPWYLKKDYISVLYDQTNSTWGQTCLIGMVSFLKIDIMNKAQKQITWYLVLNTS
jgi:hypothetical protein